MKKHNSSVSLVFSVFVVLTILAFPCAVRAEYPDRPIATYIGYGAGGSLDMCTRTISAVASKILGQPIILENKPGAGGTVALALLANAKPDGYTLCAATDSGVVRQPMFHKVTYKPMKSFAPLVAFAAVQNAIVVKKDAPWKSLKELVDYAKKNPNKIKYSTGGVGTGMHNAMAVLEVKESLKMIHVPYKGNADAMTALMGAHVDVCSAGPEVYPFERSGAIRILAIAETKKNPNYPDVPTMKELGYDFANDSYFIIYGPAGLPADVAKKIENAFAKASESKEVKTVLAKLDMLPILLVGKEVDDYLKAYWPRMEKNLKETGLIKEPANSPY
jgi:tripartite-type tricarboxylate transporter receptor subunit TctC